MLARQFLWKKLKPINDEYYGKGDSWISHVCDLWMDDKMDSEHRFDLMRLFLTDDRLRQSLILDMASGCGTFVFYGLLQGINVYGIEPEWWKHQFNFLKAKEKEYPKEWMNKFCSAVGEHIPFKDNTFDIIFTYQTLEHVVSYKKCLDEMYRVLKRGGYLFIWCPDYTSFFEAHYQVPMFPLMNRFVFKKYLEILGRPVKGLDTIRYITKRMIYNCLNDKYEIQDASLVQTRIKIYHRFKINSNLLARIFMIYKYILNIFRREKSVTLVAVKK